MKKPKAKGRSMSLGYEYTYSVISGRSSPGQVEKGGACRKWVNMAAKCYRLNKSKGKQ